MVETLLLYSTHFPPPSKRASVFSKHELGEIPAATLSNSGLRSVRKEYPDISHQGVLAKRLSFTSDAFDMLEETYVPSSDLHC